MKLGTSVMLGLVGMVLGACSGGESTPDRDPPGSSHAAISDNGDDDDSAPSARSCYQRACEAQGGSYWKTGLSVSCECTVAAASGAFFDPYLQSCAADGLHWGSPSSMCP
jgi:hypothetical protein